jgi:hypothetical protein
MLPYSTSASLARLRLTIRIDKGKVPPGAWCAKWAYALMNWQDEGIGGLGAVSIFASEELSAERIVGQNNVANVVAAPTWIVGKQ